MNEGREGRGRDVTLRGQGEEEGLLLGDVSESFVLAHVHVDRGQLGVGRWVWVRRGGGR